MIGLGVGIDYALFIVTRHRRAAPRPRPSRTPPAAPSPPPGQAVLFAGITVVIAICGLAVAGIPLVTSMGFGAAIVVAVMVVAALTLLPALLGLRRATTSTASACPARKPKVEAGDRDEHGHYHGWARWATTCRATRGRTCRQPRACCSPLAAPLLAHAARPDRRRQRLHHAPRCGAATTCSPRASARASTARSDPRRRPDAAGAERRHGASPASAAVAADPDVGRASPRPPLSPDGDDRGHPGHDPQSSPQDAATTDLVNRLRGDVIPPAVPGHRRPRLRRRLRPPRSSTCPTSIASAAAAVHRLRHRPVVPAADGGVPLDRWCRSRPRS